MSSMGLSFESSFDELRQEHIIIIRDQQNPPQATSQTGDRVRKIPIRRRRANEFLKFSSESFQTGDPGSSSDSSATNPLSGDSLSDWVPSDQSSDEDDDENQRSHAEQEQTGTGNLDMEQDMQVANDETDMGKQGFPFQVENSCDSILSATFPVLSQDQSEHVDKTIVPEISVAQKKNLNKWDKKHSCKFCHKFVTKMSLHLQRVHKNESEVIQVLTLKLGSKERKKAWGKLLNEGDYQHNVSTIQQGNGTIIPKYRKQNMTFEECVTCPFCKAMYNKSLLSRHVAACSENPGIVMKRGQSVNDGALLTPVPQNDETDMGKQDFPFQVENSCDPILSATFPVLSQDQSEHVDKTIVPEISVAQKKNLNKWDKKHSCKFCHKFVTKMSLHLQRVHKNESEVIQVLTLKLGSKERKKAWGKLLNEGDYQHNVSTIQQGNGTIIPKYRKQNMTFEECVTCPYCKAMYNKSLLSRHVAVCSENPGIVMKRGQSVSDGALLMPVPQNDETDMGKQDFPFQVENSCDSILSATFPVLSQDQSEHVDKTIVPEISVAQKKNLNKWDKKHSCKFCHKFVTKMSLHLQRVHKIESEVIQALTLKLGSKERKKAWGKLLNEGDYQHNVSTIQQGNGTIIPKYRKQNMTFEECVTCPFCKAMYNKSLLSRHVAACSENPGIVMKRGQSVRNGTLLMPVPQNCSSAFFQNILQNMRQDDILQLIQNDHMIISFGEQMYYGKDIQEHTVGHIRGQLRELGKLLKIFRKKTEMRVTNMTQILHISNFVTLVKCVRELAEFDEENNQFGKGALALNIGHSLKKCTSILKAEAIKKEDLELRQQAESFDELVSGNWHDLVSSTASQSVYRERQKKTQLLPVPVCEDIEKVYNLLSEKTETKDYATLAKATLCQIYMFNIKRGGEVQRLKLDDFEKGMICALPSNKDTLQGLTDSEKTLMGHFNRMEIRGKFNKTVPIFLTLQMVKSVKQLIELRQHVKPAIVSPYLFVTPTPSGSRPFRANDVIREFSKEAGVKDLSVFTFTHLRKQTATLLQTMELSKWEQDQLAKFLGHDNEELEDDETRVDTGNVLDEDHSPESTEDDEPMISWPEKNKMLEPIRLKDKSSSRGGSCAGKSSKKQSPTYSRKPWSEEEKPAVKRQPNACIVMNRVPIKHKADSNLSATRPMLSQGRSEQVDETIVPEISVARKKNLNKWDKKHSCKFCHKFVIKMSTHLQRVHKNESEVIQVLTLKLGSKERKQAWGKLLNEGDYQHNFSSIQKGNAGTIILKYRKQNGTVDDFVPCPFCKAMYNKSLLSRHVAACSGNSGIIMKRGQSVRDGALLMPVPHNCSSAFFQNVLQNMKQDDILRLIKNDHMILSFGEQLYYGKDIQEHTVEHISGQLRELGRLLKIFRKKTEMRVTNMTQILHISNFVTLVKCVRELAEFDEENNQFRKGALALHIGYSLKKCTSILKAEAIKKEDLELRQQAESFEELVSGNWYDLVSAIASQSVYRARRKKTQLLPVPVCEDIEKVHNLLSEKTETKDYATLAKATLCQISMFNIKRGGEVQRLKLDDFEKGMICGLPSNKDTLQGLTDSEKKLMGHFNRMEIRGKFNKTVPIFLTLQMVKSVKQLIELRQHVKPAIDSPYLFITPSGSRPFRANDVLREFSKEAGVKDLSVFTFTHLRKQAATLPQTVELSKWEQDQLAKFLGHDNEELEDDETRVDTGNVLDEDHSSESTEDDEPKISSEKNKMLEPIRLKDKSSSRGGSCAGKSSKKQSPTYSRKPWSEEEKQAVKRQLNACIVMNRVPKKHETERAIANEYVLSQRTWRNIKHFVYNIIKSNKMKNLKHFS